MESSNSLIQFLQKPFPEEESKASYFKTLAVVSLFVTLFLYIFEPFGFSNIESNKFFICLGFGGITFVSSVLYDFLVNGLLKLKEEKRTFTFAKWLVSIIGLMMTISLANFIFARLVLFGNIRWEFFPSMIYGTFAVGVFPVIVIGAISLIRQEKKYQNIAAEINSIQIEKPIKTESIEQAIFEIPTRQIRYIEALQNYVKVGFINEAGKLIEQTERATLKSILDELNGSSIVKCHRSFLVNKTAILTTSGNAQGLQLRLSDCDKIIPVSRSFVPIFRDKRP